MRRRKDIKTTIEEILIDYRWVNPSRIIKEDEELSTDFGMDSLDKMELIMYIEREYDISIPDDHAEKMDTVGKIIDYLQQILEE